MCTIAIIAVLIALLLPALSKGKTRVQRVNCVSNLHQNGVALHNFALAHGDKFPVQVSTNAGGSAEFLLAGLNVGREFYFSYRHFEPLADELQNPKVLVCPADTRRWATNFADLRNENLSYFIGANPELGRPDSILSGDRNVAPVTNSIARVGNALLLRWTEELHRLKGNVLFADGHIEEINDGLGLTNEPTLATTVLILPSIPPPDTGNPDEPAPEPRLTAQDVGEGKLTAVFLSQTNALGLPKMYLTNFNNQPGPARRRVIAVSSSGGQAVRTRPLMLPADLADASVVMVTNTSGSRAEDEAEKEIKALQAVHRRVLTTGKRLVALGFQTTHRFPWLLIVLLLIAVIELLRRRLRFRQAAANNESRKPRK